MRNIFFTTNVILYAVLGAWGSFYFLGPELGWVLGGLAFLVSLVSFFRVLSSPPASCFFSAPSFYKVRIISVNICALAAGFSLGAGARFAFSGGIRTGLPEDRITGVTGILREDPREFSDGRGMGYLDLKTVAARGGLRSSAAGRILVFFPAGSIPKLREFGRGSEIYVDGNFTSTGGGGSSVFRAKSAHVMQGASPLERFRTGIRISLLDRLSPRPWGGLALALLLGVRDTLDQDLAQAYKAAGCSHVLALSGMHLAIVSALIAFFLKKPLGLKGAALGGSAFILAYVYLVGAQPSLERSAIMYLLGTFTVLAGLKTKPKNLLGLAFLIQMLLRPASASSLSFILSYLALLGILTAGEACYSFFRGRLPDILAQPLSASLGAFIATMGITVSAFGILRPIGMLAGLIIIPLTTIFMIASIAALVLDMIFPLLAGPVGIFLSMLYTVLNRLVSLAARLPGIHGMRPEAALILSLLLVAALVIFGGRYKAARMALASFE